MCTYLNSECAIRGKSPKESSFTLLTQELINTNLTSWSYIFFVGHIKQWAPLHQRLQVPVCRGWVLQSENPTPVSTALRTHAPLQHPQHLYSLPVSLCASISSLTPAFTSAGERAEGVCTWEHGRSRYPLARLARLPLRRSEEGARPDLRLSQDHKLPAVKMAWIQVQLQLWKVPY
jgi:hypothetical protein